MYENDEINNYTNNEQGTPQDNQQPVPSQETEQPAPAQPQTPSYGGYYQSGVRYDDNQERQKDQYNWNLNDYGDYNNSPKKPKNRKGLKVLAVIACCALFLAAIGFGVAGLNSLVTVDGTTSTNSQQIVGDNSAPELVINNKPTGAVGIIDNTNALSGDRVFEKVSPSVVGVVVYSSQTNTVASGEGSGIILSADGYIVTNEHVIQGAKLIEVVLNNSERYTAKLMGYDKQTDIAVIKIDAENLVKAELGNSDELKPGEVVYAVGNPGGMEFANSITDGIISGVDRLITNSSTGYVMNCIQTTAAINPGNSGGALVDTYGRVVGISVAKLSSVAYEGRGFAIPISECVELMDDLIKYGDIKGRPLLGITYYSISSEAANFYGIPAGLKVETIDPESDAYAKGLKTGDTITAMNDQKVETSSEVFDIMSKCKAGDTVKLTVYRKGQTSTLNVVLGENDGRDTSTYISTDPSASNNNQNNNQGSQGNNNYGAFEDFFEDPFGFFPFG